jgi:hypothetical protein
LKHAGSDVKGCGRIQTEDRALRRKALVVIAPCRDALLTLLQDIVKGSGRGGQKQQQQPALGEEQDFAVHASVYGKV